MNPDTIALWLSQLRPDHSLSTAPDFSLTYAKAGTVFLLCALLLFTAFCIFKHYAKTRINRKFKHFFKRIKKQYHCDKDAERLINTINAFLKTRIENTHRFPPSAAMSGTSWLDLLDRLGKTKDFSQGEGSVLGFHYQVPCVLTERQISQIGIIVDRWLKQVDYHG